MDGTVIAIAGLAFVIDQVIGDPRQFPHPVRLFGWVIQQADLQFNNGSALKRWCCGSALGLFLPAAVYWSVADFLTTVESWSSTLALFFSVILATQCLAVRNLSDECRKVLRNLDHGDLGTARNNLAGIVGRDTHNLDESEILRAAIETTAESTGDGIVAPLFWLAIGGVPGMLAFKAVSTADSMIGYRNDKHEWFGKTAARLDDLANFVPARLTALLFAIISFVSGDCTRAGLKSLARDANKHHSPNAGWPEACLAGILGIRLGGTNHYDGEPLEGPIFNESSPLPTRHDLHRALWFSTLSAPLTIALMAACLPQ